MESLSSLTFVHIRADSIAAIVYCLWVSKAFLAMLATLKTQDASPSAASFDHVNLDHVIVRKVVSIGGVSTAKPRPFAT